MKHQNSKIISMPAINRNKNVNYAGIEATIEQKPGNCRNLCLPAEEREFLRWVLVGNGGEEESKVLAASI